MTNLRYWPFEFGRKTKANAELQKRLIAKGFDVGPDGADGIFGEDTRKALMQFQSAHKLDASGTVDRATEDALFPGNYERRTPSMNITSNWLSTIVASTAFKYILTAIGSAIAGWLGLAEGDVTAVLIQIVSLIPGVWGMWEAAKSKAVVNGNVVNLANLPATEQKKVVEVVAEAKGE